jgi:acetyl esterase/lipase
MGESAGGHLAALLGTNPGGPETRVQAVVDFYGPTDLKALDASSPNASGAIRQLLGGSPAVVPQRYADASPVTHVSADDPPFLIVQGSADPLVTPVQSQSLASRLSSVGVKNRLITVPGAGHGFGLRIGRFDFVRIITRFLRDAFASGPGGDKGLPPGNPLGDTL